LALGNKNGSKGTPTDTNTKGGDQVFYTKGGGREVGGTEKKSNTVSTNNQKEPSRKGGRFVGSRPHLV